MAVQEFNTSHGLLTMKYAMFIGRWQPFHLGHRWLIDQKLKKISPF